MDGIVTIKDIALKLGVSPTTVHKALYNKKGISEQTRQEILDYAGKNNFKLNKAASALKRRPIKLAALLIEPVGFRRFFYADILSGVDFALNNLAPFNIEIKKYYSPLEANAQIAVLERIFAEVGDQIDGLLVVPSHARKLAAPMQKFTDKGVKVITVNSDVSERARHACVASNTFMSGKLAAELMCDIGIPVNGQVVLLGGNREMYNHQRTSKGFLRLMLEEEPTVDVLEIYDGYGDDTMERMLRKFLETFDDIAGVYSNTSSNTLTMCKVVRDMGLSEKITIIGSDVFDELMPFFEDRTLTALLYQNPTLQGYKGIHTLYDMITGVPNIPERYEISTGIVFRSNAESFLGGNVSVE